MGFFNIGLVLIHEQIAHLDHVEVSKHIGAESMLQLLGGNICDALAQMLHTGIVDQDVHLAQSLGHFVHKILSSLGEGGGGGRMRGSKLGFNTTVPTFSSLRLGSRAANALIWLPCITVH